MKKTVFISLLAVLSVSSAWAQQNASAPSEKAGTNTTIASMNEHERAILVHQNMDNGNAAAHQSIIDMHRKMMQSAQ
ncbi:hypothetical protein JK232_18200 [Nissabacter archeti]|uniref:Copper-binding protein n=1 Tax=Nissabacter archeti TaxID=1917880 RepID=A0ABS5JNC3_9GAMM|nr:hypothetical protein [Nissabacter archeti]MBS0970823.1 hypothetical protein [Nissabacter archeti]